MDRLHRRSVLKSVPANYVNHLTGQRVKWNTSYGSKMGVGPINPLTKKPNIRYFKLGGCGRHHHTVMMPHTNDTTHPHTHAFGVAGRNRRRRRHNSGGL